MTSGRRYRTGLWIILSAAGPVLALAVLSGTTGFGWPSDDVLDLRLMRVLAALLVGASLSVVGVVFQTLLRNPLADPYILGVSGGEVLGGALALALGLPTIFIALGPVALELDGTFTAAFVGALVTIVLLFALAFGGRRGASSPYALILIGFAVNAFSSALVLFIQVMIETRKTQEILFWLIGNLSDARLSGAGLLLFALVFAGGSGYLMARAKELNLLSLGDDVARSMGLSPARLKIAVFLAASLVVALSVSLAGMIGFVGIIVPQGVRALVGADVRYLLPFSAVTGGLFVSLADSITRLAFPLFQTELPVGLLSALIGAPLFIWILRREAT